MKKDLYDIAVIGGGPAGLMSAGSASETGASVILLEKMNTCGRKLLISGSGRCNITNTIKTVKEFIDRLNVNNKFMYQALNGFKPSDTVTFFNNMGLKTAVEKGFKVFPAGEAGSDDVLRVLMRYAVTNGTEIVCGAEVTEISHDGLFHLKTPKGDIKAKCVIISCGGMSYPKTGSAGGGYALAEALGHHVIKPVPALVPAYSPDEWVRQAQGISLRDIGLALYSDGRKTAVSKGDLVFTDRGISGPAVYDLSRKASGTDMRIDIDLMPDIDLAGLDAELEQKLKENNKKLIRNIIDGYAVSALVPAVFLLAGADPETRAANLSGRDRKKLAAVLKAMPVSGVSFAGFERAVVTAGGVDTKEIDGRTMQSSVVSGLFFAGEVIDTDGPTGGFNLQICWSTGRLAGRCAAEKSKNI
ncbi:MAG: NAD(P)/FAD-dependent oxidoreductase [Deferribacterales bacterium]